VKLPSPTLFWRTFLLILLLIVASLLAWVQSFRVFERAPRAQQIAQQVVSVVTITRSALLYSDPALRRELLADLADNEGIRIVPLEPGDVVVPFPDIPLVQLVADEVREQLGPQTRIAAEVNGVAGNWVSFSIDGDAYWVYIERDPLSRDAGMQWVRWALVALLLSLLVAVLITRAVNDPLKRLTRAARELGAGRLPAPLPEDGPREIRAVSRGFNRMVADLSKIEQDRAVLLAGVSHDLRTPLTRLRLELDINDLPEDARAAMVGDIEQMDSIVRQFLDYARIQPERTQLPRERIDLPALVGEAITQSRLGDALQARIEPGIAVDGHRTELLRALDNLLVNASHYGRGADGTLALEIVLTRSDGDAIIEIADRGPGMPADQVERLRRPFERGETARSGSAGAGLGLAIVERVARLHGGRFELQPNAPGGLRARLILPLA
jgi:two-component system, OmpR family, osmolarity sensor histidine kinase EnvZ